MVTKEPLFIPPDNENVRESYKGTDGGSCGPSAIATLEGTQVRKIIDAWQGKGLLGFRGFSPILEVKKTLEKLGYQTKLCQGHKAKTFPKPSTVAAIVRIQWLKPDGTEYFWREAPRHSHYVLLRRGSGYPMAQWIVFCNSVGGWFDADGDYAKKYLSEGFVSSYIEVSTSAAPTKIHEWTESRRDGR